MSNKQIMNIKQEAEKNSVITLERRQSHELKKEVLSMTAIADNFSDYFLKRKT
jgi:hypothetical protein